MTTNKPLASLSLDLDNLWSYMKTHGDPGWESFPSYLDLVVPRILDFLKKRDLKITFFIVGQDAALQKNFKVLRSIAEAGHEIGNHSFHHEPWLHLYTKREIESELVRAEECIRGTTGQITVGFRGPGYSLSSEVLQTLIEHRYQYDASTLPTYLGPLARAYYFMTTKLDPEKKEYRKLLFGELRDGFRPLRPYRWKLEGYDDEIIEMPVTTMPLLKIPFHMSYIMYIYRFSAVLARAYFRMAIMLCRLINVCPSLLLHPLDFLGSDDIQELSFFPAMNLRAQEKIRLLDDLLSVYAKYHDIVPIIEHVRAVCKEKDVAYLRPNFKSLRNMPASKT
jgi:peptidoglycan-N-acetylglucosamine deacetylase